MIIFVKCQKLWSVMLKDKFVNISYRLSLVLIFSSEWQIQQPILAFRNQFFVLTVLKNDTSKMQTITDNRGLQISTFWWVVILQIMYHNYFQLKKPESSNDGMMNDFAPVTSCSTKDNFLRVRLRVAMAKFSSARCCRAGRRESIPHLLVAVRATCSLRSCERNAR